MEFVEYTTVLPALNDLGIVEVSDEVGIVRLELDPNPDLKSLHIRDPKSTVPPYPDAQVFQRPSKEIAQLVHHVIDRIHLTEVLVVPVANWQRIIDCVAFDLAQDEEWSDIDAIAALHQNTRNPLAVTRAETPLLIKMIRSLLTNGAQSAHDLIITSDVTAVLIEVFHDGAASVTIDAGVMVGVSKALVQPSN